MTDGVLIFVLADGHHNSLGLVRSLGKAGFHTHVYLIGYKDANLLHSKYCRSYTKCEDVNIALDDIIENYSSIEKIKFIVTGNDKFVSAIDHRYNQLKDKFNTYNCGSEGSLSKLMSKAYQNKLAMQAGLRVPSYAVVNVKEKTIPEIPFPVITKAINSIGTHWKDIVYLCNSPKELIEAYDKIECEQVIVQQYVEKDNETGFNGISINGGKDVYMPLQLIYKSTKDTTFGNSIMLFEPTDNILVKKIKDFIRLTGYSGSFSVDLLIGKDSDIYFLEINLRNSGWSYPYTRAGVNLPSLWIESTISGHIDSSKVRIPKLPFTVVDEYLELYDASKKGVKSILSSLWSIVKADALITYDKEDKEPFCHWVKTKIKKLG